MSKSRKIHDLIKEQEANNHSKNQPASEEIEEDNEITEQHCHISFTDFPGGSETFEIAAKFCYGVKIDISSSNVVSLRCAGEFLEMTEEYSEDNLISKADNFLSHSVLKNIKDSIKSLKSCDKLMPLAETLGITQRCIDSIVTIASSADPSLIGWPMNDTDSNKQILLNTIDTNGRRKNVTRSHSWVEDMVRLSFVVFMQLILSMKKHDTTIKPEIIESCLLCYAKKHIPGVSRSNNRKSSSSSYNSSTFAVVFSESQQKEILETIILNLPLTNTSKCSSTGTRIMFGLLRTSNILNASRECKEVLERKIGWNLEEATVDDLLIPNYSYLNEMLYDVDCVERMLGYFLEGVDNSSLATKLVVVGKQIDGYLSEIASDANLKAERFCDLAQSLPEQARLFDDGLYRAIDIYLKVYIH